MSNVTLGGKATAHKPIPFEAVADKVFHRYGRTWKPATLAVNRVYLRNQILPWFRGRPGAEITRGEVRQWFGALHATPAAANRSLPILSVIMRESEVYGYRPDESNPCTRIRRYREQRRERFLTSVEVRRLGRVLARRQAASPLQVTIVRLLLLTGCRQSEIRTLRWRDYREGHLFLRDSKTGPERCGCLRPHSIICLGRAASPSRRQPTAVPCLLRLSTDPGGVCGPRPACPVCGYTIYDTPTRASRFVAARQWSRSVACWGIAIRRPPSSTRILATRY